jgi:hypothetical protein
MNIAGISALAHLIAKPTSIAAALTTHRTKTGRERLDPLK